MGDSTAETASRNSERRSFLNLRFLPDSRFRLVMATIATGSLISAILCLTLRSQLLGVNGGFSLVLQETVPGLMGQLVLATTFSLLSAAASLVFAVIVSHRVYGPLVPLGRLVDRLKDGDYAARGSLRPGDELQELMRSLNQLAERLEKQSAKAGGK